MWLVSSHLPLSSGHAEFSVFYLDNGILAGPAQAVEQAAGPVALSVNFAKSKAIVVGRTSPAALATHLPPALLTTSSGTSRILQDFECLGAPIGGPALLEVHAANRVAAAGKLLDAVGELEDSKVAFRL